MPADRIRHIVANTNALAPDATLLLGDYVVGAKLGRYGRKVPHEEWGGALAGLKAPLGVHAVLGNHDWWEDTKVQRTRSGTVKARRTLEAGGIKVYENDAVRLEKEGQPFWLAGLGDQWAYLSAQQPSRAARQKLLLLGRGRSAEDDGANHRRRAGRADGARAGYLSRGARARSP